MVDVKIVVSPEKGWCAYAVIIDEGLWEVATKHGVLRNAAAADGYEGGYHLIRLAAVDVAPPVPRNLKQLDMRDSAAWVQAAMPEVWRNELLSPESPAKLLAAELWNQASAEGGNRLVVVEVTDRDTNTPWEALFHSASQVWPEKLVVYRRATGAQVAPTQCPRPASAVAVVGWPTADLERRVFAKSAPAAGARYCVGHEAPTGMAIPVVVDPPHIPEAGKVVLQTNRQWHSQAAEAPLTLHLFKDGSDNGHLGLSKVHHAAVVVAVPIGNAKHVRRAGVVLTDEYRRAGWAAVATTHAAVPAETAACLGRCANNAILLQGGRRVDNVTDHVCISNLLRVVRGHFDRFCMGLGGHLVIAADAETVSEVLETRSKASYRGEDRMPEPKYDWLKAIGEAVKAAAGPFGRPVLTFLLSLRDDERRHLNDSIESALDQGRSLDFGGSAEDALTEPGLVRRASEDSLHTLVGAMVQQSERTPAALGAILGALPPNARTPWGLDQGCLIRELGEYEVARDDLRAAVRAAGVSLRTFPAAGAHMLDDHGAFIRWCKQRTVCEVASIFAELAGIVPSSELFQEVATVLRWTCNRARQAQP